MTAILRVRQTKWASHAGHTAEQGDWWQQFLDRYEPIGRCQPVPGSANLLGGCDWDVECDDVEHARWLARLLVAYAGYRPTMLDVRKK